MWSLKGARVIHQSGLEVEVLAGTFENPMDLSVSGGRELSAPQLALMIREGIEFAAMQVNEKASQPIKATPKRPILKLKRSS